MKKTLDILAIILAVVMMSALLYCTADINAQVITNPVVTGTPSSQSNTINLANDAANATDYLVFSNGATGSHALKTNGGITVNPSTGNISATSFTGALNGSTLDNYTFNNATSNGEILNNPLLHTPVLTDPSIGTGTSLSTGGIVLISCVALAITSGFGTSPSIVASDTAAFKVTVGSSPGSTGVISMAAAINGWAVDATNLTSNATLTVSMSAMTTNSITLTSYSRTTGLATNFNAGDVILIKAMGF